MGNSGGGGSAEAELEVVEPSWAGPLIPVSAFAGYGTITRPRLSTGSKQSDRLFLPVSSLLSVLSCCRTRLVDLPHMISRSTSVTRMHFASWMFRLFVRLDGLAIRVVDIKDSNATRNMYLKIP